jgi:hypothetical protein
MPIPGGSSERRRLSFRALDVEQIGHVYEGLLDHTVKRATEPVLGLQGAKGLEPEVALSTLEAATAKGQAEVLELLKDITKRSESALNRALEGELTLDLQRLAAACDNDSNLLERVRPYAGLLALDTHGDPVVITQGSVFVTTGSDRRSTGTHYTPRSLTAPIVRHTLDPLIYRGMPDGVPPSPETLIAPEQILELKIVDFACGSGAFLVQACRYLPRSWLRPGSARRRRRRASPWPPPRPRSPPAPPRSASYRTRPRSGSPSPAASWPTDVFAVLTRTRWRSRWRSFRSGWSRCRRIAHSSSSTTPSSGATRC